MKPEIQAAIDVIESRIKTLVDCKVMLEGLFGGPESVTFTIAKNGTFANGTKIADAPARLVPIAPDAKPKRKYLRKTPKSGARRAIKKGAQERLGVIRQLVEPFDAELSSNAAGIDKKIAGISLCGYAKTGWIERVASGKYKRTKKFPQVGEAPASAPQPPAPPKAAASNGSSNGQTGSHHDLPEGSLIRTVYFAALKVPEPFTDASLAIASGMQRESVGVALVKLERKEYVRSKIEEGQWVYRVAK